MSKPDSDYTPHAICINGMLMGIMATKHLAEKVAKDQYGSRSFGIYKAESGHFKLLNSFR